VKAQKKLFDSDNGSEMWLVGKPLYSQSNILVTVSAGDSAKTAYISDGLIVELDAALLVDTPEAATAVTKVNKFQNLGKIFLISGYVAAIILLAFSALSFSGNVKARIVLTGSMEPAISAGDVIITTPITRKVPKINDVVAYQAKRFNGEKVAVFSHRIIGGDIENGFIMKGDANKSPDPQKPKGEDILGVVFFVIPFIGNLLTPKALFLLIPCLFGLWLIMDAMKNVE
jgi:signal peptidase